MEVLSLISDEREFQKAIHKYLVVYNCLLNLEAYNKDPIFFSSCYFVGHITFFAKFIFQFGWKFFIVKVLVAINTLMPIWNQ